jgi:hypothetical protein
LSGRLSAFVDAFRQVDSRDPSMLPFQISARLESQRNPELQPLGGESPIREFLGRLVDDAVRSGELAPDAEVEAVTDMLQVVLYGMAFHAAFSGGELGSITTQLISLFDHGLVPDHDDALE